MSTTGDVPDNRSDLHSARASSMGKSGVSGRSGKSSKSWRVTPQSFEDIDKYARGHHKHSKGATADEEEGSAEETLMDKITANANVLGVIALLGVVSIVCASIPALSLWLCALQALVIFAASVTWEEDQVLAKGGKYRGCRLLCQFLIVALCGVLCFLLVMVSGTGRFAAGVA